MNMISTGAFQNEMTASDKQNSVAEKFASVWEKKNAKAARAGGVSLMALSLAACGGSSSTTSSSSSTSTTTTTDAATTSAGTTGIDTIVGGSGDDSMSASNTTLNAGDSFAGGAGADLLAIFSSAAATIGGFTATDVETISVSSTSSTANDVVTVNMGSVSGEDTLRLTGSSSSATFTNTDNIATLELSYNSGGSDATVTYNASTIVGTADAMTVNTIDTTNDVVTLAGIETLTINNSGTSTINTLTTTAAATLNVTGDGTLTLSDIDDASLTVDMSGFSGTSTTDGYVSTENVTITGGSGADTIKFDGLTKDDSIDGGAGSDILELTFSSNSVATSSAAGDVTVKNIEQLDLVTDAASDALDFDVFSNPTDITTVRVTSTADADNVTLTDVQAANYILRNTNNGTAADDINALTIDLKDSSGTADAINLTLQNRDADADMTVTTITAAGVETVNITADATTGLTGATGDMTITNLTTAAATTLTFAGDADLTITNAVGALVTTMDASTMTGDLDITFQGSKDITATGGAGADTFTFGTTFTDDDVVDGGAGTDTLEITTTDGQSLNVAASNVEVLKHTTEGDDTLDLDDATSLTTVNMILAAAGDDGTYNNVAAGVTLFDVDGEGNATSELTIDLDKDTTADVGTIRVNVDGTGFLGDIIANDYETLTINFDYASAGTVLSADLDSMDDITATDATTITLATTNISSVATMTTQDGLQLGTINASASYTLDLTGIDLFMGVETIGLTSGMTVASASNLISAASWSGDLTDDFGVSLTDADSVTIKLDDGRTDTKTDEMLIDLDADDIQAQEAGSGGLDDDNIDTIQFVDDGTTANDIGLVIISNFQDRTNYNAAAADVIDLSALGVTGLSELVLSQQDDDQDVHGTIITSKASSSTDTDGLDFAGMIVLTGVEAVDLTADNFIFA